MTKKLDLTGKKYGKLTGIRLVSSSSKGTRWLFSCECGNLIEAVGSDVKRGETRSCGCSRGNAKRRYGEATLNRLYKTHRQGAKQRGWEPLSKELWKTFSSKPCHYCGGFSLRKPHKDLVLRNNESVESIQEAYQIYANSVDRVNNSKGYVKGNMVSCCRMCNQMKMGYGYAEFLQQIEKIHENRNVKKTGGS